MYYGYDVNELVQSSEVSMSALSKVRINTNSIYDIIGKVILISKST